MSDNDKPTLFQKEPPIGATALNDRASDDEQNNEMSKHVTGPNNNSGAAGAAFVSMAMFVVLSTPVLLTRAMKLVGNLHQGRKKFVSGAKLVGGTLGAYLGALAAKAYVAPLFAGILTANAPLVAAVLVIPTAALLLMIATKHMLRLGYLLFTGNTNSDPFSITNRVRANIEQAFGLGSTADTVDNIIAYLERRSWCPKTGSRYRSLKRAVKRTPEQQDVARNLYREFKLELSEEVDAKPVLSPITPGFDTRTSDYGKRIEAEQCQELQQQLLAGFKIKHNM